MPYFAGIKLATPTASSGTSGSKVLRLRARSDSLAVSTGDAAYDGPVIPRRQPVAKKQGLSKLTVIALGDSPRALTAGREATDNPCQAPRFFGAGGLS